MTMYDPDTIDPSKGRPEPVLTPQVPTWQGPLPRAAAVP